MNRVFWILFIDIGFSLGIRFGFLLCVFVVQIYG